ncbi:hypothetical protein JHK85_005719 [Glycine max]|nr:hypothetical protein JHK85_005719 [Glycine max]
MQHYIHPLSRSRSFLLPLCNRSELRNPNSLQNAVVSFPHRSRVSVIPQPLIFSTLIISRALLAPHLVFVAVSYDYLQFLV